MEDLQDTGALRPRLRPDGLAPDPTRPQLRPEGLASEAPETVALAEAEAPTTLAEAGPGSRPRLRPDGLGQVSKETEEAATLAGALPLDETALIGLFNGPDGGSALLRLRGGRIVRVAAGGYVDGGRVTAISEDGVRLERGDRQVALTMPS